MTEHGGIPAPERRLAGDSASHASAAEFTLLYDGACPLCSREIELLRRLDKGRGRLGLVDITDSAFDARAYGSDLDALMSRMHGVLPDGRLVDGVEAFRRAYGAVDRGWLLAWTRLPGLRRVADRAYDWFARNRLRLTGRAEDGAAKHPERSA